MFKYALALLLALPPIAAHAQDEIATSAEIPTPQESCRYFEDIDFGGASGDVFWQAAIYSFGDDWNDRISAVACDAGCRFVAFEHIGQGGASRVFADGYDTQYVGSAWNDRISSAQVFCEDPTAPPAPEPAACAYGPGTCLQGYVWREGAAGDIVCVDPATRDATFEENARAAERRAGGGDYGPNTCVQGFVWREAFLGDVVCVTPESRARAQADNAEAAARTAC